MFNELKISIVVGLTRAKTEATITYTNREQMIWFFALNLLVFQNL